MIAFWRPRLHERVVGVADALVSTSPRERLITYALGSCLGIAVYDPIAVVAGLLHAQLPTRPTDRSAQGAAASTYVDTGLATLLRTCYARGAHRERLRVSVAGGAHARIVRADRVVESAFRVGQRNLDVVDRVLSRLGLSVHAYDVGGVDLSRTMWIDVAGGEVTLQTNGVTAPLRPAAAR